MRPYYRRGPAGADAEAGGVADLQTDVMRFMAILSLCLVVIFALVQSIPLETPAPAAATPATPTDPPEPPPQTAATTVTPEFPVLRPALPTPPMPEASPPAQSTPPPAVDPAASAAPTPDPAPPPAPQPSAPDAPQGFTLQFESDAALRRLVARDAIGLYAIDGDKALRMSVAGSRVSFWPASTPEAFHEMDASTVPADVVAALRRVQRRGTDAVWGVTLPAAMQRQLDEILSNEDRGALFIGASGRIRVVR